MRLLLDTHIALRLLVEPRRVHKSLRTQVERADAWVSVASVWEVSIKAGLGKLEVRPDEFLRALEPTGFSLLPIRPEHAVAVFELPTHHRDPFDRLLIAQAHREAMTLLTYDQSLAAYGKAVAVA